MWERVMMYTPHVHAVLTVGVGGEVTRSLHVLTRGEGRAGRGEGGEGVRFLN